MKKFVAILEVAGSEWVEVEAEGLGEAWMVARERAEKLTAETASTEFRVTYVEEKQTKKGERT